MRIRELTFSSFMLLGAAVMVQATASAAPGADRSAPGQSASGAVLAVDPAAKTFTIHTKGGDATFAWDDATTVVGRKAPAFLKVGSSVTVLYTTAAGTKKASRITVHPPKRAAEQG